MRPQPTLIKIARKLRGMTMDELISAMGESAVSKMAISKFERGMASPAPETLFAIAKACHLPESFFFTKPIHISPIKFRYLNDNEPSKKTKDLEMRIRLKIEECYHMNRLAALSTTFDYTFKRPTVRTYTDVEQAATYIREKWHLGRQPLHSVYEMLQDNGITVIEMKIDDTRLLGTSTLIDNSMPVVIVNLNTNTTTERKRFTALHELGHLLLDINPISHDMFNSNPLHTSDHTLKPPTVERLCHRFAGAMLIHEDSIKRRLGEQRDDISLKEMISIRNMYGISIAAAVHRAHDLGIIPDKSYHAWFENKISSNPLETGWGQYPIMEQCDWWELLEERIKIKE